MVSSTLHTIRLMLHLASPIFFCQLVDHAVQSSRIVIRHVECVHTFWRQLVIAIDDDKRAWLCYPTFHSCFTILLPEQEGRFQRAQLLPNILQWTGGHIIYVHSIWS